jgi:hypothetical protein
MASFWNRNSPSKNYNALHTNYYIANLSVPRFTAHDFLRTVDTTTHCNDKESLAETRIQFYLKHTYLTDCNGAEQVTEEQIHWKESRGRRSRASASGGGQAGTLGCTLRRKEIESRRCSGRHSLFGVNV